MPVRGGGGTGAALAGAAAVYPLSANRRCPLRGVAAAVYALHGRDFNENLSSHRTELGAGGKPPLCRGLPARRGGGSLCPGTLRTDCPRVVRRYAGGERRLCAGLCGGGRCGHPGDRRGQPGAGQSGACAADSGTAGGQNWYPALYAGAVLVLYRTDERTTG